MKIGICTAFSAMLDFYSLTSVLLSQIKMIVESGHRVFLIVMNDFGWHNMPAWAKQYENDGKLVIIPCIPAFNKIDYMSRADITEEHEKVLVPKIVSALKVETRGLDAVFTHDLLFTGWNLPIGLAVNEVCDESTAPWFHWIHSVPGGSRDYWRLPNNSYLVYPNNEDRVRCAENFKTWKENVLVIPHCCDLRDFAMTSEFAKKLVSQYDVFGADIVQVYPIPTDRADAKGIPWVIKMMAMFKNLGQKVRLIVPNAWCTVPQHRDTVDRYYDMGKNLGLNDSEIIFTSKAYPEREVGLPMSDVKDLAMCGNIFICPTTSETFGLSLAEAAALGNLLILNDDLPMLKDICGGVGNAIWAKFGSAFYKTSHKDPDRYIHDICQIVLHHIDNSHEFKSKRHYRQNYRREAVWLKLENAIKAFKP